MVLFRTDGRSSRAGVCVFAPAILPARMPALNVPDAVGRPAISPVLVLQIKPGGKPDARNHEGKLLAVME